MNNNFGYGGFPSSNSSSFSSQYASTPTNNSTRFQRPRFAYAGPPSYPRPRSSASKPNPAPYGENFQNSSYNNEFDLNNDNMARGTDYSHGYMDSMRNNFGDTSLHLNESLNMDQSRVSLNDSSYVTCNESFYQSPSESDYSSYDNNSWGQQSFGAANRRGHSSFPSSQRRPNLNTNTRGSALFNKNSIGKPPDSMLQGVTGTFATNALSGNTRGNRGTFGQNRGNTRGRSQRKRPFGRGAFRFSAMAARSSWRCDVCSIEFTSQIPLDMHLRGSKHAKKLKSQNIYTNIQEQAGQIKEIDKPDGKKFYCELCNIIANSSLQLQMHLDGTKHKSKLSQPAENKEESKETPKVEEPKGKSAEVKPELNGKSNGSGVRRPAPAEFSEPQPTKMTKFSCDICNVFVNSDVQLQQHLSSKKHQAKVEGKPIERKQKKMKKQDGESVQPMEQSQPESTIKTEVETTSVVGVKTLSASFVRSDTML